MRGLRWTGGAGSTVCSRSLWVPNISVNQGSLSGGVFGAGDVVRLTLAYSGVLNTTPQAVVVSGSPTLRLHHSGRHRGTDRDLCRQGRRLEAGVRVHGPGHGYRHLGDSDPRSGGIQRRTCRFCTAAPSRTGRGTPRTAMCAASTGSSTFEARGTRYGQRRRSRGPAAQQPGVLGHGAGRRDVCGRRRDRGDGDVRRGGDGGHDGRHAIAEGQGRHRGPQRRVRRRHRARRRSSSATRWWRRDSDADGVSGAGGQHRAGRRHAEGRGRPTTRPWTMTPSPPIRRGGSAGSTPSAADRLATLEEIAFAGSAPTRRRTADGVVSETYGGGRRHRRGRDGSRGPVTVDTAGGTPSLELQVGSNTRRARVPRGARVRKVLTFRYTVAVRRDRHGRGVGAGG